MKAYVDLLVVSLFGVNIIHVWVECYKNTY